MTDAGECSEKAQICVTSFSNKQSCFFPDFIGECGLRFSSLWHGSSCWWLFYLQRNVPRIDSYRWPLYSDYLDHCKLSLVCFFQPNTNLKMRAQVAEWSKESFSRSYLSQEVHGSNPAIPETFSNDYQILCIFLFGKLCSSDWGSH